MNVIERIEEGSRPEPEPEPEAEAGGGTKMGLDEWIDRRLSSRFSSTKGREARGFHQTELRVTGRVHSCMARCVQSSQEGNPTLQSQMGLNQWVEGRIRDFPARKEGRRGGFHQAELRVTGRVQSCMARCVYRALQVPNRDPTGQL